MSVALSMMVDLAWMQDDSTGICPLAEEALGLARDAGAQVQVATSLLDLGRIALIEGDYDGARCLLEESREVSQRHLDEPVWVSLFLGYLAQKAGDTQKAADRYRETLLVRGQSGREPQGLSRAKFRGLALAGLAGVKEGTGAPEQAARLLGAAQTLIEGSWPLHYDERLEYAQSLAVVRARITDEAAWQSAWIEGRVMSMDDAISCGLEGGA
jgi:tetratricopeptide (TPR) repeat protein